MVGARGEEGVEGGEDWNDNGGGGRPGLLNSRLGDWGPGAGM
jgi:hypothetical protein